MDHPAYSPDLAPSDFGLFGTMKNSFTGFEFETEEELIKTICIFFEEKPKNFGCHFFHEWQRRLRCCIDSKGNYFNFIRF